MGLELVEGLVDLEGGQLGLKGLGRKGLLELAAVEVEDLAEVLLLQLLLV